MRKTFLHLRPLTVVLALTAAFSPLSGAYAQQTAAATGTSGTTATDNTRSEEQGQVLITGSRIRRASAEGPTSVTVITGQDIEKQGYKNVFDALSNQTQNTGFTQGADFGNTFTPAANAISLRGLGPNHTLILINGRRVADYPVAYDGSVNFVNLANIPSALVDRIEILNGGGSAIYGSDAIAGVVNVILKKQATGVDLNVKVGGTERGGGENQRLQLSGGTSWDKLNALFGIEISQTEPIWAKQRDFMSSTTLYGAVPTAVISRKTVSNGHYIDPGDTCSQLASLYDNSLVRVDAKKGSYCASGQASPSYWTTQTENRSQNFFGSLNYALENGTELFAEAGLGVNHTENNTRGPSWTSAAATTGYFQNQNTGAYEVWTRRIAPEEIGGATRYNRQWDDVAGNIALGFRGDIKGTSWNYETTYNYSSYHSKKTTPVLSSKVDDYFLGPQLGTDSSGVPIYAPDPSHLNSPLTPAIFNSITDKSIERDKSYSQTVSFSANGNLFNLPAGTVKLATVVEAGSQGFTNSPDPRLGQGAFYNATPAQEVTGTRKRYAAGAELSIPILKDLIGSLAGRYDDYSFAGRSDSKFTYNAGLEYRPVNTLLLRSNYSTSFRAPDMNYIFAAETRGYYASTTDYYQCKLAGQPVSNCDYANVSPGSNYVQTGNKDLRPESGKSFGYGVVWSPTHDFDVSVDYWNIQINDLVTTLDADKILRDEADCRTGVQDINSPTCVDALNRVKRNPANAVLNPNAITSIWVNPINAAQERTSGVDISGKWRVLAGNAGEFLLKGAYTKVLKHTYRQFANDPVIDELTSPDNTDWPDKLLVSLTWTRNQWSSTLQATRLGSIPNGDQSGRLSPYTVGNASATYSFNKRASVSVIVNNVTNSVRLDPSGGWPFYPVGNYSPYGRQGWVEFNYHFGS